MRVPFFCLTGPKRHAVGSVFGLLTGLFFAWTCSGAEPPPCNKAAPVPQQEQVAPKINLDCVIESIDITAPLQEIVSRLAQKKLLYASKPLTDCSGIFHRLAEGLTEQCPEQEYPPVSMYRSSREIAKWFHERGNLVLIKDAVDSAHLIRPGVALFFGRRGKKYKDFNTEELFSPATGVQHVGVVVNVHKDEAGRLIKYELFHGHGRRGRTPASITDRHCRKPTRSTYPPFGNGRQQLVALAPLSCFGRRQEIVTLHPTPKIPVLQPLQ